MACADRSVGKKPVRREVGDGGSECDGKKGLLGGSVDSEKVLREGDVVG